MQFLVRMRTLHPLTPADPAARARLGLEQLRYWDDLRERGKLVFTAAYAGRRGRVAVYEAEDVEELFDLVGRDPLFSSLEREVVPLVSNDVLRRKYQGVLGEGVPAGGLS